MKHGYTFCAGMLLGLCWWLAASVSREHSTTADEIFHLTAGYSYWQTGDYRLQPENGNLPQRWAALPLLLQEVKFPPYDQPAWLAADVAEIGHQFFYESGNDLPHMLASSRSMVALLGAGCGLLVVVWSRSLFGRIGSLVSLGLFTFCPLLLAHAGLATSDMAAALGFLAATLAAWRLLHGVTPGRVLFAGAVWGLLALAKFSAPLFAVIFCALVVVRLSAKAPLPVRFGPYRNYLRGKEIFPMLLGTTLLALLLAWLVIWAGYGFRFNGLTGAGSYNHAWSDYGDSFTVRVADWARAWRLLPEPWLHGFAHTAFFAQGRPAFFMGEYSVTGWAAFFPTAFILKTTLPALALLVLALATMFGFRRHRLVYRTLPLFFLVAVYGGFALASNLNIGVRHLLPVYPALYVLAGAVALNRPYRWMRGLTAVLLLGHAATSFAIRPHYLAYFNPLLGGPSKGYRHFVDSSLDWGQDLPGLQRWLDAHGHGSKVFLSYFGSGSPDAVGIKATRLGDGYFDLRAREVLPRMTGGIYCISATMFQQVYTEVRHGWSAKHESQYAALNRWLEAWQTGKDHVPRDVLLTRLTTLEHLRFGRLCAFLQDRTPDATIGYSILIFRLSDTEVEHALKGPMPAWPRMPDQP